MRVPAPAKIVRASTIERVSGNYGARTYVTLPDGYRCCAMGRLGKGEAVRFALWLQVKGWPTEAKVAS